MFIDGSGSCFFNSSTLTKNLIGDVIAYPDIILLPEGDQLSVWRTNLMSNPESHPSAIHSFFGIATRYGFGATATLGPERVVKGPPATDRLLKAKALAADRIRRFGQRYFRSLVVEAPPWPGYCRWYDADSGRLNP